MYGLRLVQVYSLRLVCVCTAYAQSLVSVEGVYGLSPELNLSLSPEPKPRA